MNNYLIKKIFLSLFLGFCIGFSIFVSYAVNINSTTQTISSGAIIEAGFFTDLQNRIININGSGGNIGIGTTTPSYKLHVNGDIYGGWIRTSGTTGWYSQNYDGGFYMSDTTWIRTQSNDSIWTGNGILGSQGGLSIGYGLTSSPAGGAIIAGNVGIGTPSPGSRIESYGNGAGLYLNQATASDLYIRYHIPGIRWWTVGPKANGDFWFSNSSDHSSSYSFGITSGGNVGIGTSTPTQKLEVVGGSIKATGGFIIETRAANPAAPETGRMWLINP